MPDSPLKRSVYRKSSLRGNRGKLSPGGARVGHASLMRPDRPLPTRLSVLFAATPQPEHRDGDYRGLGTPVASRLRL
jgi:hypothetical protein